MDCGCTFVHVHPQNAQKERMFDPIPLFYRGEPQSLATALYPHVVGRLSGRRLDAPVNPPHVFVMGDLEHVRSRDVVCGAGFNEPKLTRYWPNVTVNMVRGPLSRAVLKAHGIDCPEIYGDILFLLPRFRVVEENRKGVGVIPDPQDRWMPEGGDKRISTNHHFDKIIDFIAGCEVIVTSSLTVLMVAEAYGIPAVIRTNSYHICLEPVFKIADYYAGTGRDPVVVYDKGVEDAAEIAQRIPAPKVDTDAIFFAFWKSIGIPHVHIRTESGSQSRERENDQQDRDPASGSGYAIQTNPSLETEGGL